MKVHSAQPAPSGSWTAMAAIFTLFAVLCSPPLHADDTFVYAVQITATVRSSPPQILIQWQPDPYGANSYTIYRKSRDATSWGTGVALGGSTTSYADNNVAVGTTYEYQVVKAATFGYTGYGYIYSGIAAPLTDNRGKLVLVVANTYAGTLANELNRLQEDLVGDGWQVIRHDVSSTDTPANVRNLIISDYNADPANVKAVFLFGHVPILRSGTLDYDTHGARPMPADGYYGDINGNWGGNPSYLPSDVELMVGRVDFFNMPGNSASPAWPSEAELLRRYLNKDHAWRTKQISVPRRALMGNRVGDEDGEAPAACGYRNFEPFLGAGNLDEANVQDNAPVSERWISVIAANRYLWAYGNGGGDNTAISQLGTHGIYHDVWSTDIVSLDAKAVFTLLYGSHLGEWDTTDNIMRSVLATPTMGLTCAMGGRPHWYLHHMGLGEPIGFGARLTMNNNTLYRTQTNAFPRGVLVGLMGDPTLRMEPVAPPSNLSASRNSTAVNLAWSASPDANAGYHMYRSGSSAGPFTRVTSSPVTTTSFTDTTSPSSATTYMVRAVKLETNPSGSYYNASQGLFASVGAGSASIRVTSARSGNNVILTWNTQSGTTYRVLAKDTATQTTWTDISGSIMATGSSTSWTASNISSRSQRFYKIASP